MLVCLNLFCLLIGSDLSLSSILVISYTICQLIKIECLFTENSMKLLMSILILSFIFYGCVQPTAPEDNVDGNNEPIINDVIINPLLIRVGTSTTITIDATDPDGDFLSYSWAVALGDIIGSGHEVRYTAAFCCVGINTVNLVVSDSRGASISHSINLEVSP